MNVELKNKIHNNTQSVIDELKEILNTFHNGVWNYEFNGKVIAKKIELRKRFGDSLSVKSSHNLSVNEYKDIAEITNIINSYFNPFWQNEGGTNFPRY